MRPLAERVGQAGTFGLAALAAFILVFQAIVPAFHAARFGVALLAMLLLHLAVHPRLQIFRETLIYSCFLGYMLLQLLWTPDRQLALNTLVPAANVILILVLFGSLAVMYELRPMLGGLVFGFIAGALAYTGMSEFPFAHPAGFSYNAIAMMYLFGLVATLLLATVARHRAAVLMLSAVIVIHIVATTSIKTNLGMLLGVLVATTLHFGQAMRAIGRHLLLIVVAAAALGYAVASSEVAVETLQKGAGRIVLGLRVLQAREDIPGYSAFERRANWQREGFQGLTRNPLFGHGVEAFRAKFGITSHASHVDIAYNSGLIGLALFYGVMASVLLKLYRARGEVGGAAPMVILGSMACLMLISFAGAIHYNAFLAAIIALSVGVLKREKILMPGKSG